jgi:lipid A ethanolaminephosphotransferase
MMGSLITATKRLLAPFSSPRNPVTLAMCASLWLASLSNWPLWQAFAALPESSSLRGRLFLLGFGLIIAAVTTAILSLLAWRWTIKPVVVLFLLAAAFGAHFMGAYGVVIDPTMMVNVIRTDVHEVSDLLSLQLLFNVLLLSVPPLLLLWRVPLAGKPFLAQSMRNALVLGAALVLAGILIMLSFAHLSSAMRNHKELRYMINPLNSFYALGRVAFDSAAIRGGPPAEIGKDVRLLPRPADAKPPLVMLVLGETARSDHFSLNGYSRTTNPETSQLDVISFREVMSCGTNTEASLPCMLSHFGRDGFVGRAQEYENLLDLLQRAGMAVLWLENQSGCKGLCERVPHAFASAAPVGTTHAAGLCNNDVCLDEALFTGLDERLAAMPEAQRKLGVVLVMHQMGSHGPAYSKRSPEQRKPFMPECTSKALQECSQQQLVNVYDNSIAYTDHVLAQGIDWLSRQQASFSPSMLYMSDHGESLGENNLYLHGLPYAIAPREQKHVPMILWLTAKTAAAMTLDDACLRKRKDEAFSHDNLFHSVMGLAGLTSTEYRADLDVFHSCRAAPDANDVKSGGGIPAVSHRSESGSGG